MGRRDGSRRRYPPMMMSSDPQLNINRNKNGFPPGTTVDELRWYSRRKNDDRRRDNLQPEEGSLKDATSEYTRCFKAPPMASHSLGDIPNDVDHRKHIPALRRYSSHSDDMFKNAGGNVQNWRSRRQNLKLEGEMLFQTENADEFIEYVIGKRPDLMRRKTQLRLEGDMDISTESRDEYVLYADYAHTRPPPHPVANNLRLEGDQMHRPEYRDVFIDFPRHRPTLKRPTAPWLLSTDGGANMPPRDSETLSQYVGYDNETAVRSEMFRRPTNLRMEGEFAFVPEYADSYRAHPIDAFARSIRPTRPNLRLDDDHDVKTTEDGAAIRLEATECGLPVVSTDAATKPPASPKTPTNNNAPNRPFKSDYLKKKNSARQPLSNVPVEDKLASRPPRSRNNSRVWSPTSQQQQQQQHNQHRKDSQKHTRQNSIADDEEFIPKYNIYGTYKPSSMKMPENNFGEDLESKPEYRRAYLDYLIREKMPKRNTEDVKNDNEIEEVNQIMSLDSMPPKDAKDDKTALAVYQPSARRISNASVHSSPRRRSASPSYKMHVTNVDEPKKGFAARSMSKDIQNLHLDRSRRDGSLAGYPSQREASIDTQPKISTRSNWIKNIAQHYHGESEYRPSFVVLEDSGEKQYNTRRKWDTNQRWPMTNERVQY